MFPAYFAILLATLLLLVITGYAPVHTMSLSQTFEYLGQSSTLFSFYVVFSNIFILFMDAFYFLAHDGASVSLTADYQNAPVNVYRFFLLPHGWSVSIELMFYILAPFLLRRSCRVIFGVFMAAVALRFGLPFLGLPEGGWQLRLFPFLLPNFIAGYFAYLGYLRWREAPWMKPLGVVGLVVVSCYLASYAQIRFLSDGQKHYMLLALAAVFCAPIFTCFQKSSLDSFLGDLSYPLYVVHLFAFSLADLEALGVWRNTAALVLAILLAVFLKIGLERPMGHYRARIILKERKSVLTVPAGSG